MPYLCAMLIKRPGRFPGNKKSDTMKPEDIYNGLEYTAKEINRTFKIKVFTNGCIIRVRNKKPPRRHKSICTGGILRSNRERYLVDAVPQKYIVCRKLQNNPQK